MNPDWVYGVSFALWGVWLQRHRRWSLLWQAMTGSAIITGTRAGGGTGLGSGLIPAVIPPSGGGPGGSGQGQLPESTGGGPPELPVGE